MAEANQAEIMVEEWTSLANLIDNTQAMGNLNAKNLLSFQSDIDEFLRRWTLKAAQGEERLWIIIEQAGGSLKQKLNLGRDLAEQSAQADLEHRQRMAEGAARVRQLQAETAQIKADSAKASQEAADQRHQMWLRSNFPQRYCQHCSREYVLPHHFCHHCHCSGHHHY